MKKRFKRLVPKKLPFPIDGRPEISFISADMMKVSTRGRYALRLMIELAQRRDEGYISLKEISARQDITVRYLEQIIAILLKAGFVQSLRGKTGGYRLSKHPREYTTEDILKLTEGSLLPLSCTVPLGKPCPRAADCATLPFWRGLQQVIGIYLRGVTLEDLAGQQKENGCDYGAGI